MRQNGLYYYFYLFARALGALKVDQITDVQGVEHPWRRELSEHLFALQQLNGSWVNSKANRWFSGDPNLVTAYVPTALAECEPLGQ